MNKNIFAFAVLLLVSLTMTQCNGIKGIKNSFDGLSPYEQYVKNLETANLHERPMVQAWMKAGQDALEDSLQITLPYSETGQFLSHQPKARAYRFNAKDGQVITVNGATSVTANARIFTDLFILQDNKWKHQASSDSSLTLSYEFTKDTECLLRIQPELLVNAYYKIVLSTTPVLINPVLGASNRAIQSFYGASRDGGKRKHEGVDIFAKKGTPVIAPTSGVVSRIGYTRLGGKVVWMFDQKRKHSYYFAHLDSQYVKPGKFLKQGDTLGVVGNTGNAKFTPPHLHFGIYQAGSKDPLYYIKSLEETIEESLLDTSFRVKPYKIVTKKAPLYSAPSDKSLTLLELPKDTYVEVVAQTKKYFRVILPDDREAFVTKEFVAPADSGVPHTLTGPVEILSGLGGDSVVLAHLPPKSVVQIKATYQQYAFVKTSTGIQGWVSLL